jgi:uncharacterized protein YjiS (DUF1127 family)
MMEESLHPSLDCRHDAYRGAVRRLGNMFAGILPAARLLGAILSLTAQSLGRAGQWRTMPLAAFSERAFRDASSNARAAARGAAGHAPGRSCDGRCSISATDAIWRRRGCARAATRVDRRAVVSDLPLIVPASPRSAMKDPEPLTALRQVAAAIREWRWRIRSHRELGRLSNHLLKDIGLRREETGYRMMKPHWRHD